MTAKKPWEKFTYRIEKILQVWPFGRCMLCSRWGQKLSRRMLCTMFAEKEKNFTYYCQGCHDGLDSMYQEQWKEYYRSVL